MPDFQDTFQTTNPDGTTGAFFPGGITMSVDSSDAGLAPPPNKAVRWVRTNGTSGGWIAVYEDAPSQSIVQNHIVASKVKSKKTQLSLVSSDDTDDSRPKIQGTVQAENGTFKLATLIDALNRSSFVKVQNPTGADQQINRGSTNTNVGTTMVAMGLTIDPVNISHGLTTPPTAFALVPLGWYGYMGISSITATQFTVTGINLSNPSGTQVNFRWMAMS